MADAFLAAVIAGDAAGALAYLDPRMFAGQQCEPAPADVERPLRAAARLTRYTSLDRPGNRRRTGDRRVYETSGTFAAGSTGPLWVYLIGRGSRLTVAGYSARDKVVVGKHWNEDESSS